jgi:hypothetical protein
VYKRQNLDHRLHHVKDGNHNWDQFFLDCVSDTPIKDIIELVGILEFGHTIIFVSDRGSQVRQETLSWIETHIPFSIDDDQLLMRAEGDFRPDHEIKLELIGNAGIKPENIFLALDDRDQVVQMWRKNGIRCLQVANGNF